MLEQSRKKSSIECGRGIALSQNMSAQLVARQQADSLIVKAGIAGGRGVRPTGADRRQTGAHRPPARCPGLAKDLVLKLPVKVDTRNGLVEGRIQRIDPAVKNGSVTIDVGSDRPDLSVEGRIQLGTLSNSIRRPSTAGAEIRVHPVRAQARRLQCQRMPVRFGTASSNRIEVREWGQPGDQAILSDTSQWVDYQALRLH